MPTGSAQDFVTNAGLNAAANAVSDTDDDGTEQAGSATILAQKVQLIMGAISSMQSLITNIVQMQHETASSILQNIR